MEDGAVELLNVLFPHLAGVHVERVVASGRVVRSVTATTRAPEVACPVCGHPSSRVHSRYVRWLADRGVSGREMSIQLQVRRFFRIEPRCPRRIFAEQVPGLTERHRRCSPGLRAMLTEVGLAVVGSSGRADDVSSGCGEVADDPIAPAPGTARAGAGRASGRRR